MRLLKRQEGFTLNEILISVALIAIGILGFSLNTMGVIQGNQISGGFTIATNLSQDKLEELKAAGSFTDGSDSPTTTGGSGGRFTRTWTITTSSLNDASSTAAKGSTLKEISVTVSWTEYGSTRQVEVKTLYFQDAT